METVLSHTNPTSGLKLGNNSKTTSQQAIVELKPSRDTSLKKPKNENSFKQQSNKSNTAVSADKLSADSTQPLKKPQESRKSSKSLNFKKGTAQNPKPSEDKTNKPDKSTKPTKKFQAKPKKTTNSKLSDNSENLPTSTKPNKESLSSISESASDKKPASILNPNKKNSFKKKSNSDSKPTSKPDTKPKIRPTAKANKNKRFAKDFEKNISRPKTKIEIRNLPFDLPKHIFWKSIEKHLPWYEQSKDGVIIQIKKLQSSLIKNDPADSKNSQKILSSLKFTENSSDSQKMFDEPNTENSDNPSLTKSAQVAEVGSKELEINLKPQEEDNLQESELLQYLGPTQIAEVPTYDSENLKKLDTSPYYRLFIAGKPPKRFSKISKSSRAYIGFKTNTEATSFINSYKTHKFVSKTMLVTPVKVDFALSQMSPNSTKNNKDQLLATIDKDSDFIEFVKKINAENSINTSESLDETMLSSVSRNTNPASSVAIELTHVVGTDIQSLSNTSTVLLDYLRKKKQLIKQKQLEKNSISNQLKKAAKLSAAARSKLQETKNKPNKSSRINMSSKVVTLAKKSQHIKSSNNAISDATDIPSPLSHIAESETKKNKKSIKFSKKPVNFKPNVKESESVSKIDYSKTSKGHNVTKYKEKAKPQSQA
ncbi:hypothetical protein BB561_002713 [Smittium simulii]|uniref:UPF3 domain-containing protein n=1 Tax=Smittium simulii TaxID=133385 RepID=A0A2T9YPI1_9FUNG|nr:hypothetical protein BB561_002713 [Smittium simulii]